MLIRFVDSVGFPHLSHIQTDDQDPTTGLLLGIPWRYYLVTQLGIPLEIAVKIARELTDRNLLYDHDLINTANRDTLYRAFHHNGFTKDQSKHYSTGLVKLIRQGDPL